MIRRLLILLPLFASHAHAAEIDRMNELAARTAMVARAVHYTACFDTAATDKDGTDLIAHATARNPSMLGDLTDYYVTAHRQGQASAVLVCDKERRFALIEDAGCTQPVEAHRWQENPRPPCDFSLALQQLCR